MRKQIQQLLEHPASMLQNRQTLEGKANSIQQIFYQTIGNLYLLKHKAPPSNLKTILGQYKGAYSGLLLQYKYMGYCMENKLAENYHEFNILSILSDWIETFQRLKTKKQLKFQSTIAADLRYRSLDYYEDCIVYLNYISLDLITLLKLQKSNDNMNESSNQSKVNEQISQRNLKLNLQPLDDSLQGNQQVLKTNVRQNLEVTDAQLKLKKQVPKKNLGLHLQVNDLLNFLNGVMPRILFNIIVPIQFFPQNFLEIKGNKIDLLYRNQNIQILARTRYQYQNFLKTTLKLLCDINLQQNQCKQLIMLSFRYYYLFHHDKNLSATQIIIQCFKKLIPAVRFALCDQILLFFTILRKLGKDLFINYLKDKFDWVNQLLQKLQLQSMVGNPKQSLIPFPTKELSLSHLLDVPRGTTIKRYFEVFHKYSLLYFRIRAVTDDISIRLYFLGAFNSKIQKKQLLFSRERESSQFQGSVQVVQPGIYVFEFDNSYSWIKGKTVIYEQTILVPLQIIEEKQPDWLQILFEKIEFNTVPQDKILHLIKSQEETIWKGQASFAKIILINGVYNLTINRKEGSNYQYQTEDKNLLIKKIKTIDSQQLKWWLFGKIVKNRDQVIHQLTSEQYCQLQEEQMEIENQQIIKNENNTKQNIEKEDGLTQQKYNQQKKESKNQQEKIQTQQLKNKQQEQVQDQLKQNGQKNEEQQVKKYKEVTQEQEKQEISHQQPEQTKQNENINEKDQIKQIEAQQIQKKQIKEEASNHEKKDNEAKQKNIQSKQQIKDQA